MELDTASAVYRSVSGQECGQMVTTEWTRPEEKNVGRSNATNQLEQAEKEIAAHYKKKKKLKYFENSADIDNSTYFKVMLAKGLKDYEDEIDWGQGVGVQIKYNGGRMVATKDGLWTRKGERYLSVPHIEEALRPFFLRFPEAVIDGECFNNNLREKLNEIMKLCRKTVHISAEDFKRSKELIRYFVYDGYGFGATENDGYLKRKEAIDKAFHSDKFGWRYKNIIGEVPTWVVRSRAELETLYKSFLANQQEGAIIRILDKPYEHKRSKFLLKYKPQEDAEFRIVDIQEGSGNWSGCAKIVTCQRIDGKKFLDGEDTFDATFKGSMEDAAHCLKNKRQYIGKIATIHYFATTGYGKPNFAQFDISNWDKQ